MTFFQNPFTADYRGIWQIGDRQQSINYKIRGNSGRGDEFFIAWSEPTATNTYDISGNDADSNDRSILTFVISTSEGNFKNWAEIAVDVAGATPAATTVDEIVTALNNDNQFNSRFTASIGAFDSGKQRITVRQKLGSTRMRSFVRNTGAETVLQFNARAGVAELPSYFHRHIVTLDLTAAEQTSFTDGVNQLVQLDPQDAGGASDVDDDVISNAVDVKGNSLNLDPSTVQADWQLLRGESGLFTFQKITVDGSDRITEIIEYQAGAVEGDFAKRTTFTYTGTNTNPDEKFEQPHVLATADLITP